jgi:hypothetical protein
MTTVLDIERVEHSCTLRKLTPGDGETAKLVRADHDRLISSSDKP